MLSIAVKGKLDQLAKAVGTDGPKKLRRETYIAINKTATRAKKMLAKEIGKELATTPKEIKRKIGIPKKANANRLSATVSQRPSGRLPLRAFKPTQTRKGVSVRVSKKEGRKVIPSAFIVTAYGSNVYLRPGQDRATGGARLGPSPWGVTVKNKLNELVAQRDVEPELLKQIDRRIRAVNFKRSQGR